MQSAAAHLVDHRGEPEVQRHEPHISDHNHHHDIQQLRLHQVGINEILAHIVAEGRVVGGQRVERARGAGREEAAERGEQRGGGGRASARERGAQPGGRGCGCGRARR